MELPCQLHALYKCSSADSTQQLPLLLGEYKHIIIMSQTLRQCSREKRSSSYTSYRLIHVCFVWPGPSVVAALLSWTCILPLHMQLVLLNSSLSPYTTCPFSVLCSL
jgi:hypothetical protein